MLNEIVGCLAYVVLVLAHVGLAVRDPHAKVPALIAAIAYLALAVTHYLVFAAPIAAGYGRSHQMVEILRLVD